MKGDPLRTGTKINEIDFCVIDTETTGGSAEHNRVIEVAVFHYQDGIILDRFQTLLNPGIPIPSWITMLTGIDDAMVRNAPRFEEVAPSLRRILDKGVFVAHNAMFDYRFIQSEFMRLGEVYQSPNLCTVRLARLLFPELSSRSLGVLCDHLLIDIFDRHRAAGDAEATVYVLKNLLQKVARDYGIHTWEELEAFVSAGALHLPQGIPFSKISELPQGPGFYLFKDANGEAVFKGKANNVQRRIKTFFKKSNQSEKSNRFREIVRAIEIL